MSDPNEPLDWGHLKTTGTGNAAEGAEPAAVLAVRKLLDSGVSYRGLLQGARQSLESLKIAREEVRKEYMMEQNRSSQALHADDGGRSKAEWFARMRDLDLRATAVTHDLNQAGDKVRLLEQPWVIAKFDEQNARVNADRETKIRELEAIEEHLRLAAEGVRRVDPDGALVLGSLQRLADYMGGVQLQLPSGAISPVVKRRGSEKLSAIFGGGPRTPPAQAA